MSIHWGEDVQKLSMQREGARVSISRLRRLQVFCRFWWKLGFKSLIYVGFSFLFYSHSLSNLNLSFSCESVTFKFGGNLILLTTVEFMFNIVWIGLYQLIGVWMALTMVCNIMELISIEIVRELKTIVLPFFCTWVYFS